MKRIYHLNEISKNFGDESMKKCRMTADAIRIIFQGLAKEVYQQGYWQFDFLTGLFKTPEKYSSVSVEKCYQAFGNLNFKRFKDVFDSLYNDSDELKYFKDTVFPQVKNKVKSTYKTQNMGALIHALALLFIKAWRVYGKLRNYDNYNDNIDDWTL